jgi:hypothetical protein
MKRVKLTYNNEPKEVVDLIKQGYKLGCPKCDSDLVISFYIDPETQEQLPSLIDCPQNSNHYGLLFDYNSTNFWEKVDKKIQ